MSAFVNDPSRVSTDAAPNSVDRRRVAIAALIALAGAGSLLVLTHWDAGTAWTHWLGSLVALGTALVVVVIAELTWQRAVHTAAAAGLVEPSHQ
jgi:hypothetical protein